MGSGSSGFGEKQGRLSGPPAAPQRCPGGRWAGGGVPGSAERRQEAAPKGPGGCGRWAEAGPAVGDGGCVAAGSKAGSRSSLGGGRGGRRSARCRPWPRVPGRRLGSEHAGRRRDGSAGLLRRPLGILLGASVLRPPPLPPGPAPGLPEETAGTPRPCCGACSQAIPPARGRDQLLHAPRLPSPSTPRCVKPPTMQAGEGRSHVPSARLQRGCRRPDPAASQAAEAAAP